MGPRHAAPAVATPRVARGHRSRGYSPNWRRMASHAARNR